MGAQTVRTVTPLSKCRATWCFFPAQTPATREKPPNSRSNPYVSQYACLPWAGKRDKGSVGQNKEPTKETRNRLNFSWGNIGRKPKFFIRRKHCIGPRHSSKKRRQFYPSVSFPPHEESAPRRYRNFQPRSYRASWIGSTQRRTLYISRRLCPF